MADNPLDYVLDQLQAYGLEPISPRQSWVFGKLTRCPASGDKAGEKNGWYVLHEYMTEKGETLYFGAYGDWRQQESQKLKVKGTKLTPEERDLMRARQEEAKRKAAETKRHAARRAAKRAAGMWEKLPDKGRSAYLDRKQIIGFGVRYGRNGTCMVPMRTFVGGVVGLQVIHAERQADTGRDKQYWPAGMEKEGAHHLIGPRPEPGEPILVCEGFATGASLHMATSLCVAVSFDAGNLLPVGKALREEFPGRPLIFCADDDWKTTRPDKTTPWNPGVEKAENAAVILGGQFVVPVFAGEREEKWTDWNDLHVAEGLDAVRRQVMAVVRPRADGGWYDLLLRTSNGALCAHMINVSLILGNDERWKGVLGYNTFSSKTMALRTPPFGGQPGEWTDLHDMLTVEWLAQQYGLLVKSASVLEAVSVVASKNSFHPVRDYLEGLTWDGTARLESWLYLVCGVPLTSYSMKVAKRWMIGAVARIMRPGSKVDNVLILEGGQGEGKSTLLAILGGEWFMDTPFTLGDKEAFQMIRGKWIVELGELDAFNKADSTKAKQFFSASTDTFRESYGRRTADVPRQCVFAGTTNQEEYLKDTTGNRRYWPVLCEKVEHEALREIRDQLWAEAMFCYQAGDIWWVEKHEKAVFEEEQDARYTVDAWEHKILPWLEDYVGETVTSDKVLGEALNLDFGHWGKPEQMRVGHIMHRLGWRRERLPSSGKSKNRPWGYRRPKDWRRAAELPPQAKEMPF
ncbi:VapE domain-containing protein [Pseudomonas indica]|uniref:Putative DNA primase/helicase n=1 Tax=Pseudomonas indica TaxID=137658 RepID=A0A1G8V3J3_9PSED|nr:VapE domain-containing protein [Pseudomonas indica]SDJ60652.1 putative DNA primase/helicase [Pseudomonas indica]